MKMEYESPVLEVFSFDVQDNVMDSGCPTYQGVCPLDGVCSIDVDVPSCPVDGSCILDGVCITDGTFPNPSSI